MKIPNADFLERTGSENLSARLWRYPPKSAGTLHKHIRQKEFCFVLEGTGRLRVGDETLATKNESRWLSFWQRLIRRGGGTGATRAQK